MEVKCVYMLLFDINEANNAVIKIGRTNNFDRKRKKYDELCQTIAVIPVIDEKYVERILLREFRPNFLSRMDIGYEYFESDFGDMLLCFNEVILELSNEDSESESETD